jgi:hypothetical protein
MFEPLLAGVAIAFSAAAPWIVLATIATFFVRQPLKVFYLAKNNAELSSAALRFLLLFVSVAAIGLAAALFTAGAWALHPLAIAAPLAMQQVFFDLSKRNRSLMAELSGAIAISSSSAALLLAGGIVWPQAMAVWAVFVCRFVPSILYVRERLSLEKGKAFERLLPITTHVIGLIAVTILAQFGLASWLTAAVMAFLTARAAFGLSEYRTRMKAMKIGVWEVSYGALFLVSIIAGHYLGI